MHMRIDIDLRRTDPLPRSTGQVERAHWSSPGRTRCVGSPQRGHHRLLTLKEKSPSRNPSNRPIGPVMLSAEAILGASPRGNYG
jgi:hypothetical protein